MHWPHAPTHRLSEAGTYIVTSGTFQKAPIFQNDQELRSLCKGLLKYAERYQWQLEAWAVFPNHYHFIAHSPVQGADSLAKFLSHFHMKSAQWINKEHNTIGRKIWHNFWETRLTYQKSYLARLNYVHQNAVKHRLVKVADQYPWCSAGWFQRVATRAQVKTIYDIPTDTLSIDDDY